MSKSEMEFKTRLATNEVITLLEDLVQSMKDGKVVVERGEDTVVITPEETTRLEMECYQKKDKAKLAFELKWSPKSTDSDSEKQVKISSQEPVIVEEQADTEDEQVETAETEKTEALETQISASEPEPWEGEAADVSVSEEEVVEAEQESKPDVAVETMPSDTNATLEPASDIKASESREN